MIKLDDIKSRNAINLLLKYNGINPYIKELQNKLKKNGKIKLTEGQVIYINDFHDVEPQILNKVIAINPFLGESLKETHKLPFTPERILVQAMLADQEKTYHVYGKLTQKQKYSKMYWLPKTMVLDDPYFTECDLEIDWDKYENLDINNRHPYEHQKKGIEFLVCRDGAILADHMGLGKSFQSIIAALEVDAKKILIICPSSMKITWEREIASFNEKPIIVNGSTWPHVGKFTIINYEILKNFHTLGNKVDGEPYFTNIVNENYDLVILDEAHKVKNPKAQRTKLINDIVTKSKIERVWLLTGTPITNKPMDFFNLLKLVKAPIADNWKFYAQRYCEAKSFYKTIKGYKRKIWVTDGASNLEELGIRTKNNLLRRLKSEVLDMPDKTITTLYHDLSKRGWADYENLWEDYLEKREVDGKRKVNLNKDLVELGLLRKFIAMEAIPKTIELAEDIIEQGQKVVIFTTFTEELEELSEHFKNCVVHNGKMSTTEKQKSVDKFQNNKKCNVFIGNITSAGVGITLTEGSAVVFNSFSWVPGDNEQAEDRCHRIGQKSNVSVYYQLFRGTISFVMWYSLMNKQKNIDKILQIGGKTSKRLTNILNNLNEHNIEI